MEKARLQGCSNRTVRRQHTSGILSSVEVLKSWHFFMIMKEYNLLEGRTGLISKQMKKMALAESLRAFFLTVLNPCVATLLPEQSHGLLHS